MLSLSQVHGALVTLVSRDSVGYPASANPKTAMLVGTRTLYGLAQEGHAPKLFTRLNRFGVPWMSVAAVGSFLALGYMTLYPQLPWYLTGSSNWFQLPLWCIGSI
jgi:amino acid permease